jgi:CBS domain-containing protein
MKSGIQVADAMTINVISVTPEFNLAECGKIMAVNKIGALVVKNGEDSLGIITETDIVRKAVASGANVSKSKVKDFMETNLVTITPKADIYDALVEMKDHGIRHLPVVDSGKVVGLLTVKDILKIEPQLFELIVDKYELKEESRKPINRIIPTEGICQECGEYSEKVKDLKGVILCESCAKSKALLV